LSRTWIRHALLFDGEAVHEGAGVLLEGGRIAAVAHDGATSAGASPDGATVLDAGGRLVTPGLVNAHTHIYSTLATGIGLAAPPPSGFVGILEKLWWPLDRALELDDIVLSARLCAVELDDIVLSARLCAVESLRSGVTTLFDHHASQRVVAGTLSAIADALLECGPRACLCYEVSDRAGEAIAAAGIAENEALLRRAAADRDGRLRGRFGLHASMTLGDATLAACRRVAEAHGCGYHVHVAESMADQEDARRRGDTGVVERLARHGVLGPRTLCVHGVHLDDAELERLARSRAHLVHCPQSNMQNAVGAVDLERVARSGVRLALGTDGMTTRIGREALCAHLLQHHRAADPRAGNALVAGLLLDANARLASETFDLPLGRLTVGAPADLVVWDYLPATPVHAANVAGHLLFGLVDARATDVLVGGEPVLAGGRSTRVDEEALRHACRAAASAMWRRFEAQP
jgi:putative selenium metabolism protein SsnA